MQIGICETGVVNDKSLHFCTGVFRNEMFKPRIKLERKEKLIGKNDEENGKKNETKWMKR